MFTKVIAFELAKYGIHVNCLCPGPAYTQTKKATLTSKEAKERFLERMNKTPLGARSPFEEMANCLMFLVSSRSEYVTGQALIVDGGYTAVMEV